MAKVAYDFRGRRAFVTGAGGGIGHAIACDLVRAGCEVVALDIKPDPADFPDGPGAITYLTGDLLDPVGLERLLSERLPDALDYVVNAAGVAMMDKDGSVVDVDLDVWERTLAINLTGAVHVVRLAVPRLIRRGGGALVHIASVAGARSMDNVLEHGPLDAYQVSKAALISLSRGLALTYGRQGIRSNTICPGAIRTPMTDAIYADESRIAAMAARTPADRVGRPEDVARSCLFLLSDDAGFVTGVDLPVDGGLMAKLS